jgi:hypothetical protein
MVRGLLSSTRSLGVIHLIKGRQLIRTGERTVGRVRIVGECRKLGSLRPVPQHHQHQAGPGARRHAERQARLRRCGLQGHPQGRRRHRGRRRRPQRLGRRELPGPAGTEEVNPASRRQARGGPERGPLLAVSPGERAPLSAPTCPTAPHSSMSRRGRRRRRNASERSGPSGREVVWQRGSAACQTDPGAPRIQPHDQFEGLGDVRPGGWSSPAPRRERVRRYSIRSLNGTRRVCRRRTCWASLSSSQGPVVSSRS